MQEYTESSLKTVYYRTQLAATQKLLIEDIMNSDALWRLQQAVFDAKMDLLSFLVGQGHLPCKPSRLEIEIRLTQESLPSEATNGKTIELAEERHDFVAAKLESRTWL